MTSHEISENRARKRYLASKKGSEGVEADWTPFRVAEKLYKAKWPKPDLVNVLDLATLQCQRTEELSSSGWIGGRSKARRLASTQDTACAPPCSAFAIPEIPGG